MLPLAHRARGSEVRLSISKLKSVVLVDLREYYQAGSTHVHVQYVLVAVQTCAVGHCAAAVSSGGCGDGGRLQ